MPTTVGCKDEAPATGVVPGTTPTQPVRPPVSPEPVSPELPELPELPEQPGTVTGVSCQSDQECGDEKWCRQKNIENGRVIERECVTFAAKGESCGGYTLPQYESRCNKDHRMECAYTGGPMLADAPGTCQEICSTMRDAWGQCVDSNCANWNDGCNLCTVQDDYALTDCTERECFSPISTSGCMDEAPVDPPTPEACCKAMTAECLACSAGKTKEEYCEGTPTTVGCETDTGGDEPPMCCMAMTAECLACSAGKTKEEYCERMPTTVGCTPVRPEQPEQPEPVASKSVVRCELTFEGEVATLPEGSQERADFTSKFETTMAAKLGIAPADVKVSSIRSGSVVVSFDVTVAAEKVDEMKQSVQLLASDSTATFEIGDLQAQLSSIAVTVVTPVTGTDEPTWPPVRPEQPETITGGGGTGGGEALEQGKECSTSIGRGTRPTPCAAGLACKIFDGGDMSVDRPNAGTCETDTGGDEPPMCCMAMTAECLACSAGKTKEEYCEGMPTTVGCTDGVSEDSCRDCMAEMQDATRCAEKCLGGNAPESPKPDEPKPDEPKPEETACPDGTQPVSCFSDPCSSSTCPAKPRAQCKANYCGGCNAVWFVGTTQLSADDCTVSENPSGTDEPVCCMAMTAECLACSARKTKEEYCEGMPTTVGCTDGVSEDSCRDCMAEMQDATRCADKCSRGTDEPTRPDQPPVRPGQGGEGEDGPPAFMSCVQDQLEPYLEAQDTLGLAKFACEDAKLDTAACSSADRVLVDGEIKELCALTACTSCMEVSRNPRDCAEKCAGVEEDEDRPRPASDPPPQTAEDVKEEVCRECLGKQQSGTEDRCAPVCRGTSAFEDVVAEAQATAEAEQCFECLRLNTGNSARRCDAKCKDNEQAMADATSGGVDSGAVEAPHGASMPDADFSTDQICTDCRKQNQRDPIARCEPVCGDKPLTVAQCSYCFRDKDSCSEACKDTLGITMEAPAPVPIQSDDKPVEEGGVTPTRPPPPQAFSSLSDMQSVATTLVNSVSSDSQREWLVSEAEERRKEMDAARDQEQELREQAQQADAGARQGFEDQLKEAEKNRMEAESQVERVERDTRTNTILQAQGERGLQTSVEDARKEACVACKENSRDPRYCAPSCDEPREDGSSDGPSTSQMRSCRDGVCQVTQCRNGVCETKEQKMMDDVVATMDIPRAGSIQREAAEEDTLNTMRMAPAPVVDTPVPPAGELEPDKPEFETVFDSSKLEKPARLEAFKKIKLKQGEEMKVACDTGESCELCTGDGGCQFEEGSQVSIETGTFRLPEGASGSAVKLKMAAGTQLKLDGTATREVLGELNGDIDLTTFEGELKLANVGGAGNVHVGPKAKLLMQGSTDDATDATGRRLQMEQTHDLEIDSAGRTDFAGRVKLSKPMRSSGLINITAGE
jgi:hypothetical protein